MNGSANVISSSPTIINPASWFSFRRRRESLLLPSGSSFGFPSVSTKLIPLSPTIVIYRSDKVPSYSYQAFESRTLCRTLVHPQSAKVERTSNAAVKSQLLKNISFLDLDTSTCEDAIIPDLGESLTIRTSRKEKNPRTTCSYAGQSNKLDHISVIKYPLGTESGVKAMLESNTLAFVVDKRADKKSIRETFTEMFKVRAKKVNTLIMPDGTKKAYIMLAPDFKALDVAKKFKIL